MLAYLPRVYSVSFHVTNTALGVGFVGMIAEEV